MADLIGDPVRHPVAVGVRSGGKRFIGHLHAFRGFAILNIVAIHAWWAQIFFFRGDEVAIGGRVLNAVNETFFHDSTPYFALISGLLFSLVLQSRGWVTFFKSKLSNVVSPYIAMTLVFTWYAWDWRGSVASGRVEPFSFFEGSAGDYLIKFGENLLSGGAIYHLWYIPILLLLYGATPLLAWVLAHTRTRWLIWPIMIAPLGFSRTFPDFSWGTVIYFVGAYAVGMFVGTQYERAVSTIHRHRNVLLTVAFLTTLALLAAYLLDYDMLGPVSGRETLFYAQKLSVAALVLLYLRSLEGQIPEWLNTLGTYAFSIYFLHVPIQVLVLLQFEPQLLPNVLPVFAILAMGFVSFVVGLIGSLVLSGIARHEMGTRSRMLLGA
jgi:surface polysaccharide O-acyltransferase-like enzyme